MTALKPQSDAQRAANLPWVRERVAGLLLIVKDPKIQRAIIEILYGREHRAAREPDADAAQRARLRARHTCVMATSSMNCRACNRGIPYPALTIEEIP